MSEKGPDKSKLEEISRQSEHDLNSYQSKTGRGIHKGRGGTGAGVIPESTEFPGASAKYGEEFISSKSYNRRIPTDEGGDVDDKGHFVRGYAYEGIGGPEDKTAHIYQHNPGGMDESLLKKWGKNWKDLEHADPSRPDLLPPDQAIGDARDLNTRDAIPPHASIMERGRLSAQANLGLGDPESHHHIDLPPHGEPKGRGNRYKGYAPPEAVPDERAYMGEIPPESVTEYPKNME